MGKLTAKTVKALKEPGMYGDGDGLYLAIKRAGIGSWVFRWKRAGKLREMGLGSAGTVTLAEAREKARQARDIVQAGGDPLGDREAEAAKAAAERASLVTFRDAAEIYITSNSPTWKNAKHRQQWVNTMAGYVYPAFGDVPVRDVDTTMVLKVLEPIWREKPETAVRIRGRIETVLDAAKARGQRAGENPALWKGHLANILPARSKVARVQHHAALDFDQLADFMTRLAAIEGIGPKAFRFLILTATRTSETLNAVWDEIDLESAVWSIPGERMKAGRPHRVPLSPAAVVILTSLAPLRDAERPKDSPAYLFPGRKLGTPLSNMSLLMTLRRMGNGDLTAHGFRSTFRDWAAERTAFPGEVAEAALAHTVRDAVEAAYRRGDLFEKRRRLMEAWADFASTLQPAGQVVPINRASA